jgi:hypothetical protein
VADLLKDTCTRIWLDENSNKKRNGVGCNKIVHNKGVGVLFSLNRAAAAAEEVYAMRELGRGVIYRGRDFSEASLYDSNGGIQRSWTSAFSSEAERVIFGGEGVDNLRGFGGIGGGGASVPFRMRLGAGVAWRMVGGGPGVCDRADGVWDLGRGGAGV